jgi:hypothetical protein
MNARRCVAVLAVLGSALATVAGCSGTSGSTAAHRTAGPSASSSGAQPSGSPAADGDPRYTARLPIAAYAFTDSESAVIAAAQDALVSQCMRQYGLAYQAPLRPPAPAVRTADRRYGLSSAFDAARFGYHLAPDEQQAPAAGVSVRPGTPQYTVLFGAADPDAATGGTYKGRRIPDGGCQGQARSELSGRYGDSAGAAAAATIADDSYTRSTNDPAVREAVAAWSRCMRTKGYDYPTPMAAMGDKAFLQGTGPSAHEIATAEADMSCKRTTDLLAVWFAAERRLQLASIARQLPALDSLAKAHASEIAAARKIVEGA